MITQLSQYSVAHYFPTFSEKITPLKRKVKQYLYQVQGKKNPSFIRLVIRKEFGTIIIMM